MNNCLNCGKDTSNPKFCSKSCSASYNNKITPKRKCTRKCSRCDQIVRNYRSSLCEEHFLENKENQYRDKTLGEYRNKLSVKGKHPSWVNAHVRGFARSWLKHLAEMPCCKCGYHLHVELAHIKAVSDFSDDDLLCDVNSEENVIPLCPNCHWEFDNLPRENFFN
jgi:hypothetical protein